jgi:hypothetical protein
MTKNEFRLIDKMNNVNNGNRTLFESIIMPEIVSALNDWINNCQYNYVLIGGLALSYYVRPRSTTDVDVLFLNSNDLPKKVSKFKKHRELAFQHNITHVEIETVIPESINLPIDIAQKIFDTAIIKDNIKIASPSGLIAMKLFRFSRMDQADIENLILNTVIDLTPFNIPLQLLKKYNKIKKSIRKEG